MKLRAQLWLPLSPHEVFPFFADAHNLEEITPSWLQFSLLERGRIEMRQGTRIDYRLRLHGVPIRWQSEITVWDPPFCFRDEQRRGPYRRWSHTHTFASVENGTLCTDEVDYDVPGGRWVYRLFVRRDVYRIFSYRQRAVARRFTGSEFGAIGCNQDSAWSVALFEPRTI